MRPKKSKRWIWIMAFAVVIVSLVITLSQTSQSTTKTPGIPPTSTESVTTPTTFVDDEFIEVHHEATKCSLKVPASWKAVSQGESYSFVNQIDSTTVSITPLCHLLA